MFSAAISKTIIREALEDDISALVRALAPDVGARQLAQRWEEHRGGYRRMLVAEVEGRLVSTVSIRGCSPSADQFAADVRPRRR